MQQPDWIKRVLASMLVEPITILLVCCIMIIEQIVKEIIEIQKF
jgi:hypothetical protein